METEPLLYDYLVLKEVQDSVKNGESVEDVIRNWLTNHIKVSLRTTHDEPTFIEAISLDIGFQRFVEQQHVHLVDAYMQTEEIQALIASLKQTAARFEDSTPDEPSEQDVKDTFNAMVERQKRLEHMFHRMNTNQERH